MASKCLAAIKLCRIRVTRLEADGTPSAGPNNVYVSDNPISLGVTPNILTGEDRDLIGGCDCLLATYRGNDKFKRWDFEMTLGKIEPALMEMLLGDTAITDSTDVIGGWFSGDAFDCSNASQPNVAIEAWQELYNDSAPDADWPYLRWIFPSSFWQRAASTLQNDWTQLPLTGFSRGNDNWGEGPYHDQPESAEPLGGYFYDDTLPTAACGYQTHSIT